ncbi:MAG: class I SAM-dependent methyltransferase [Calditrichaeota bacterium]|nr:MAG: class I SAM-dependent methyltransferase [Calditrichota bacterium]
MEKRTYHLFKELQNEHWWFAGRRQIVASLLKTTLATGGPGLTPGSNLRILEVGCGTGAMLGMLGQFGEVWGVDQSTDAVEICHALNFRNVYLANEFSMAPNTVDLLSFFDVIEHVQDDAGLVQSYLNYLKPGGWVVITVPAFQFLWSDHDEVNHHYRRYTRPQLQQLITRLGLQVERMTYFNAFLFPPIALARMLQKLKRKFVPAPVAAMHSDFERPHQSLDRLLQKVFASERFFLTKLNFPFGVSLLCIARNP